MLFRLFIRGLLCAAGAYVAEGTARASPEKGPTGQNSTSLSSLIRRKPQLEVLRTSSSEFILRLYQPWFYDLDPARYSASRHLWIESGSGSKQEALHALFDLYAVELQQRLLTFCDSSEPSSCRPCSQCEVKLHSLNVTPTRTSTSALMSQNSWLRFDRVRYHTLRRSLCSIDSLRLSEEEPQGPHFAVFAPPVVAEFILKAQESMARFSRLRLTLPGWSVPFVAESYGIEIEAQSDSESSVLCRSIEPQIELQDTLPNYVYGSIPLSSGEIKTDSSAKKAPQAEAYRPPRDKTKIELLASSGVGVTIALTRPHIFNLDAAALASDGPGRGWDIWDPEGWSRARCAHYRSVQCLMLAYADYLASSQSVELIDEFGQMIVCGSGCSVQLLDVELVQDEDGRSSLEHGRLRRRVFAARVPEKQSCEDCVFAVPTKIVRDTNIQFMAPNLRIVLEIRFPLPFDAEPRVIVVRHPGVGKPRHWFAGIDVGLAIVDASGLRVGRARSFCEGSLLTDLSSAQLSPKILEP